MDERRIKEREGNGGQIEVFVSVQSLGAGKHRKEEAINVIERVNAVSLIVGMYHQQDKVVVSGGLAEIPVCLF